jgi:hypothetical protein
MNEFHQPRVEKSRHQEVDPRLFQEQARRSQEQHRQRAETAEANNEPLEAIRERVEKAEAQTERHRQNSHDKAKNKSGGLLAGTSKKLAYQRTIKLTQKRLSKPQRSFSKVVHQPMVEALSNAAEVTVARPSGLFMGGLLSVVSSLVVLYICRHYGYEYNFMVSLATFVGGFLIGVLIESSETLFFKFKSR